MLQILFYLIDFGLCKKYRSSKTGKHILPKRTGKFSGIMKFASFYALSGKEQSRRDDLISLGYMLIFLVKKNLPWNYDLNYINKEKYEKLVKNKRNHGNGSLFNNIPKELEEYIRYTYNLKFEQEPNYEYLKSIFKNFLFKTNLDIRNIRFKWINNKELTGLPRDKSKRKSNSQSRLMKELRESSTKRIRDGKSQDIDLRNNKNKCNINVLSNSKTSLNLSKRDYDENENNKNRNIKLKTLSNSKSLDNINNVYKRKNNTIKKEGIKNIYYINDNSSFNFNRSKIIKEKLNPVIFNDNNKENINIIYFNKNNIISKNRQLKTINNNKTQVNTSNDKMNTILTDYYHTRDNSNNKSEKDIFRDKVNNQKSSLNISNNRIIFRKKIKVFNRVNHNSIIQNNNNSGGKITFDNIDLTYNTNFGERKNNISNNLIFNNVIQNNGIMIINNYNNKVENNFNQILIKPRNDNSELYKNHSPFQEGKLRNILFSY